MTSIRQRVSTKLREQVFRHYQIPFSRSGVNVGLLKFFKPIGPINYVDIGASAGDVARAVGEQYGIKRAILIEPQPGRCAELRERFSEPTYSICECAVSNHEVSCEMDILNWDFSSSILPLRRDIKTLSNLVDVAVRETISCRTLTLDKLLSEEATLSGSIDLIKIDVQGAELMVFRGAEQSLRRTQFILTEVSFRPLYDGACEFGQVYAFLSEIGFRLLSLTDGFRGIDNELVECDALFGR